MYASVIQINAAAQTNLPRYPGLLSLSRTNCRKLLMMLVAVLSSLVELSAATPRVSLLSCIMVPPIAATPGLRLSMMTSFRVLHLLGLLTAL